MAGSHRGSLARTSIGGTRTLDHRGTRGSFEGMRPLQPCRRVRLASPEGDSGDSNGSGALDFPAGALRSAVPRAEGQEQPPELPDEACNVDAWRDPDPSGPRVAGVLLTDRHERVQQLRHRAMETVSSPSQAGPAIVKSGRGRSQGAARSLFRGASGLVLDRSRSAGSDRTPRSRAGAKPSEGAPEVMARLAGELDSLFAEMGRNTSTVRAGVRVPLKILPGTARTIEVCLPQGQLEGQALTVQVDCHKDTDQEHATSPKEHRRGAKDEGFDVSVSESQRQASGGPYRGQSLGKFSHSMRVSTDFPKLYVVLASRKQTHVIFGCRIIAGNSANAQSSPQQVAVEDDDVEHGPLLTASVGYKLQLKVSQRRQELGADHEPQTVLTAANSPKGLSKTGFSRDAAFSNGDASPGGRRDAQGTQLAAGTGKARLLITKFLDDGKAPTDEIDRYGLLKTILALWRPLNKYFVNCRRARGQWVLSLSSDCPKKLIKFLRKVDHDRHALTSVAMAGCLQFFIRRQRELCLMRARMAVRQLAWYKMIHVVSRFRYMMVFLAKEKEREALAIRNRKTVARVDDSTSSSDGEEPVEEVRRYAHVYRRFYPAAAAAIPKAPPSRTPGAGTQVALQRSQTETSDLALAVSTSGGLAKLKRLTEAGISGRSLLEIMLAQQGFFMRPPHTEATCGSCHTGSGKAKRRSFQTQKADTLRELSEALGHQVNLNTPPPVHLDSAPGAAELVQAEMVREANERTLMITVSPRELQRLTEGSSGKVRQMGARRFREFHGEAVQRVGNSLARRRARIEELESSNRPMPILKRYRLRFFEEDVPDLPFLSFMQTLMLVIMSRQSFHTPQEKALFDARLKDFKQIRRAALKKSGVFAPMEAALWAHPVVLQLAASLQKAETLGDSSIAWKTTIFDGRYVLSSCRDSSPASLFSHAPPGGTDAQRLRKLADIGGAFVVRTAPSDPAHLQMNVSGDSDMRVAMSQSGFHIRGLDGTTNQVVRTEDCTLDVACSNLEPHDIRIESLRRRRRDVHPGNRREGVSVAEDAASKAQKRYTKAHMTEDIYRGRKLTQAKAKLVDSFDALATSMMAPVVPLVATMDAPGDGTEDSLILQATRSQHRGRKHSAHVLNGIEPRVMEKPFLTPPTTIEDIEALILQSDVLKTISDIDSTATGHRCPTGWSSGYRDEPMTKEEIRRARVVERSAQGSDISRHLHKNTTWGGLSHIVEKAQAIVIRNEAVPAAKAVSKSARPCKSAH